MSEGDDFDVMSDLCIKAAQAVMQNGSEELQAVMRVALAVLGQDIARTTPAPVNLPAKPARISHHAH